MCVIAVCKKRKMTLKEIEASNTRNDDGIGVAWSDGQFCYYKKGMEVEEFKKWYSNFTFKPHVVHFRLTSVGEVCPELTHPFVVSAESEIRLDGRVKVPVLFHNGTFSEWSEWLMKLYLKAGRSIPSGPWSDSRVIAVMLYHLGEEVLELLSGRYAIVYPSGEIKSFGPYVTVEDDMEFSSSIGNSDNKNWNSILIKSSQFVEERDIDGE